MISTIICTNKYTNTITNILEYEKDFLDISSTSILYIYETTGEQIEMSKSNIAEIYMYLVPFSIFLITIKLHKLFKALQKEMEPHTTTARYGQLVRQVIDLGKVSKFL